ncbi:MAG: pilus assembly PilX N-terminal domain-containing protein [Candidatus Saccharimonadales bacterium]
MYRGFWANAKKNEVQAAMCRHDKTENTIADQRGMAAILITMVVMTVIMLIVLGFATISRREQRQTLDNQLQSQAFYAAESGVNDAKEIASTLLATGVDASKPQCDMGGGANPAYSALRTSLGNAADNVRYSCVIVDPDPIEINNSAVVDGSSWVAPLATDGTPPNFTIMWRPKAASGSPAPACNIAAGGSGTYLPANGASARACQYPVLRVDLIDAGNLTSDVSAQNRKLHTYYFQPSTSVGGTPTTNYNPPGGASLIGRVTQTRAGCDGGGAYGECRVQINPGTGFTTNMAMRVTSLYGASDVTIRAGGLPIKNSQLLVDVTGRAQDVLRRVQVRIPIANNSLIPSYAIQSGGAVCKRYAVDAASFTNGPFIAGLGVGEPMCTSGLGSSVGTGQPAVEGIPCTVNCGQPAGGWTYPAQRYRLGVIFVNATATNGLTVTGCEWNFGDGTTLANQHCNPGDNAFHDYALPGDTDQSVNTVSCSTSGGVTTCTPAGGMVPFPEGCNGYSQRSSVQRTYIIRLTVYFSNGTSATSPPTGRNLPYCY